MIFTDKVEPYLATIGMPETQFFRDHLDLNSDYMLKEIYGVKTKICKDDALKLYEMAYYSYNILELGCFQGASTFVMANACKDSGFGKISSVDLSLEALPIAKKLISDHNLDDFVEFYHNDAATQIKLFKDKFDFIFVDHDHSYQAVYDVCVQLDKIMDSGYVFFHDFQDYRNGIEGSAVQVYRAVMDGLSERFKFIGLCGQGGLFVR